MKVEITAGAPDAGGRTFLTWAPVQGSARLAEADDQQGNVEVTLRNGGAAGGGRVVFDKQRRDSGTPELRLSLPADGTSVPFWVAGEFQHPSINYGDAAIEAVSAANVPIGRRELMVRIRKNAIKLTDGERDRFLLAIGTLNDAGQGLFRRFRDTHVAESEDEAHGFPGFPPWHRAYLLDLERELQRLDSAVALPYWRFDEPSPTLFAPAFLGLPPADETKGDVVEFPHGHALEFWRTDQTNDPIERRPWYDISQAPPLQVQLPDGRIIDFVITQDQTMALGTDYASFRGYEGAPHGMAHVSFDGPINVVSTAAKDPLFFLLHNNVDRLWAFWQWVNRRHDIAHAETYSLAGDVRDPDNIGHKLDDDMWPWNGSRTAPRPDFPPPRGDFPTSPIVSRPGPKPMIRDMIDYQGVTGGEPLGFDYDDVPFELHTEGPVA